jgi:hypothetical protein
MTAQRRKLKIPPDTQRGKLEAIYYCEKKVLDKPQKSISKTTLNSSSAAICNRNNAHATPV